MTFDLPSALESRLSTVRTFAAGPLAAAASDIDRTGMVPADLRRQLDDLHVWQDDALTAVVLLEELATASAAAAARVALGQTADGEGLAGLRGVQVVDQPSDKQCLGLAAVCVGIGRAAIDVALSTARARGDRASGEPGDPPHWALADAATEIDAARLLLRATASGEGLDGAGVLVHAGGAAQRAVDAVVRVLGSSSWQPGSVLERCARDSRAALLVAGTEDAARKRASDRLLA